MTKTLLNQARKVFSIQYLFLWILLLLILYFSQASETFHRADNLLEIARSSVLNAVLVLGLTWIVASGEIDVTFPDIAALSSMIVAYCVTNGYSWAVAIPVALVVCALYGLLSGVLINVFKFRSLIATIGVATLAKSTAYFIGKGSPVYLNHINPSVDYVVYGKVAGVPVLVILVTAVFLVAHFLQNSTKLGQYLYALGENRQAALEAGISEKKIMYSFFILSAVLAAAAGVLLVATFTSGQPNYQGTYFVDGLTAVFLGAMVFRIGKPNVIGTLVGALFIMVLGNGLTLLGTPFYYSLIIKGILMVVGVVIIALSRSNRYKQWRVQRRQAALAQGV
jgi:ribose transport system permease protein